MKKIECVLRTSTFDAVRAKLKEAGIVGMTVSRVRGYGRQHGIREVFMGAEYTIELVPKVKLEMVVHDEKVNEVVEAVCNAACTGSVGDGKIFIYDVQDAVRIRTGEKGDYAV